MSLCGLYNLFNARRALPIVYQLAFPLNHYAKKESAGVSMLGGVLKKKKGGLKGGPTIEKRILPVETDVNKLVKFVCGSNIYKTGEDIELKPDSEYPEWLWTLRTGPPPTLDELDPNSKEYWLLVRKFGRRRKNKLAQLRRF